MNQNPHPNSEQEQTRREQAASLQAAMALEALHSWERRGVARRVTADRWVLTEFGLAMFAGWATTPVEIAVDPSVMP